MTRLAAIDGAVGGVIDSIVANDMLTDVADPALGTSVTLSASGTAQDGTTALGLNQQPSSGSITLDVDTGEITIASGTTAGSYTYSYQICEVLNPDNCDTATISITVDATDIVANDDTPARD